MPPNLQPMHRQVLRLATAQALFQTASVLVVTVGSLSAREISSAPELATAPIASMYLGTLLSTIPASLWMARAGRRAGFVAGALLGVLGGMVAAGGMYARSLPLLALGTMLVGGYQGFAQFYRFAASEVADESFRSRAISLVLAGGIVAALLGPALGAQGAEMLTVRYAGSFLLMTVSAILAAVVLLGLRIPVPHRDEGTDQPRPLFTIMRQPAYAVALFAAATGAGVMVLAMTATPLAMTAHHYGLAEAKTVIQAHVLGMFLPSFFTGSLVRRFGVFRIMLAGAGILAAQSALSQAGITLGTFFSALFLLGVGWNFLFIGGTTLLTSTYRPSERGRAQAANDLLVLVAVLLAALSAGALLDRLGWRGMNLALIPLLVAVAVAVVVAGKQGSGKAGRR